MTLAEPLALLEALLFVSPEGITLEDLSRAAGYPEAEAQSLLQDLDAHYRNDGHGLRLQCSTPTIKLVTAPEVGGPIGRFLGIDRPPRLSAAARDALAIIAYRQPVTRVAIEAIRGVNSDHTVTQLLNLGLVEEVGRAESVGRPVLYGTTAAFLESAGLTSLADLPPLI